MRKTVARLIAAVLLAMACLPVATAYAVSAGRYMSNGSGGETKSFLFTSDAITWIQGKAKGWVNNLGPYSMDLVVLRDQPTEHHAYLNWRGPGYDHYNASDPDYKSLDIQYTLRYMGHPTLIADNYYGPGTTNAVRVVQANNALTQDGVTGPGTYEKLATKSR
ncbi:MAG: peptidoglycan-binding domain-containing protein [Coriobacteriia bacterium]|nr:peptidoglycan-binding domain-containing protein [Coriobacteriia bacterium]